MLSTLGKLIPLGKWSMTCLLLAMPVSLALPVSLAVGQDRETKVRNDRRQLADDQSWLYNDLESGFAAARDSGRPLLIVLRCIP